LRNAEFRETTLDPVMTMLSIGVEKLMKMGLGLVHLADEDAWPPQNQFKNHWRHNLELMNGELLAALRARLPLATHRAVIEPMLEAVESDPGWGPIVTALTRYGIEGRFYYLDELAEHPQSGERPDSLWDHAENALLDQVPELKAQQVAALSGPQDEFDAFLHVLEGRMAESIEAFWRLLEDAGMHGMLGVRGHQWGADVGQSMVGRQIRR
jgi:hypothetical protein